jgi:cation diffusion facilitator CzcD-associated flavoprotein CzcO
MTDVAVIGAGFAGLGTASRLRRAGRTDFVVLERAGDVGGTWRDNSYPGCVCDVPSRLYSFSFAPNADWTRSFSPQPEIWSYLRRTAQQRGLLPHIRFGTELLSAAWDETARAWQLRTSRGPLTARVLVLGVGALSEPSVPDLPGLSTFTGTTFHSARWDHDHDLTGERVAVVGTGASAIQFVPQIQPRVGQLTVFQRTPPWVLPHRDRSIGPAERWLYRHVPATQQLVRAAIYTGRESWVLGFAGHNRLMQAAERAARRHLHRQVSDPDLRRRLTPDYRLGCKRVLLSNAYYPALMQPNVRLVTDRIVAVRPRSIVTAGNDGTRSEHPVDTIIFGTGFHVTDPPVADRISGVDGRTLAEHWKEGMSALHGLTVAGFPNMFFLLGPNTGLGHTSVVVMLEAQFGYLVDALRRMDEVGACAIEPKEQVQQQYNAGIQRMLRRTVWNSGGCASWYLDRHGRNTTLWPTYTFTYRRRLRRCNLDDYHLLPPPAPS